MEKFPGIELEHFWPTMMIEDKLEVVKTITNSEKSWTSISFKKYGSIYCAKDLHPSPASEALYADADGVSINDPSCNWTFYWTEMGWKSDRAIRQGTLSVVAQFLSARLTLPGQTIEEYHAAIGRREIAAVRQLPQLPKSPISLFGPGTYILTRERKLKALECYLQLILFLIPPDPSINSSHL